MKRVKQWAVPNARYYRRADFNSEVLAQYQSNLEGGLVDKYAKSEPGALELVSL